MRPLGRPGGRALPRGVVCPLNVRYSSPVRRGGVSRTKKIPPLWGTVPLRDREKIGEDTLVIRGEIARVVLAPLNLLRVDLILPKELAGELVNLASLCRSWSSERRSSSHSGAWYPPRGRTPVTAGLNFAVAARGGCRLCWPPTRTTCPPSDSPSLSTSTCTPFLLRYHPERGDDEDLAPLRRRAAA